METTSFNFGIASLKVIGSLFLLLAILFLVLYLLKRFGPRTGLPFSQQYQMKILGQLSLGAKKKLILVRFLNRILLLGVTDSKIELISEMEADHENEQTKEFSQELSRKINNNPDSS